VPTARDTVPNGLTLYYLRNANRMLVDSSVCDIPEFTSFIIQWIKMRCYEKEGDSRFQLAGTLVDQQRRQMIETLTSMVPDGDNEIDSDVSHYRAMMIEGDM